MSIQTVKQREQESAKSTAFNADIKVRGALPPFHFYYCLGL
jgi:hypothetical protein